jgi:hypothetical protein
MVILSTQNRRKIGEEMKYYVTIKRIQKITYEVEASSQREAQEQGLLANEIGAVPYDVNDSEDEILSCISYRELLHYRRQEVDN